MTQEVEQALLEIIDAPESPYSKGRKLEKSEAGKIGRQALFQETLEAARLQRLLESGTLDAKGQARLTELIIKLKL